MRVNRYILMNVVPHPGQVKDSKEAVKESTLSVILEVYMTIKIWEISSHMFISFTQKWLYFTVILIYGTLYFHKASFVPM